MFEKVTEAIDGDIFTDNQLTFDKGTRIWQHCDVNMFKRIVHYHNA